MCGRARIARDRESVAPTNLSYVSIPWTSVWDMAIDPMHSQIIYSADHHSDVYLFTTGGTSWVPISDGLTMKAATW